MRLLAIVISHPAFSRRQQQNIAASFKPCCATGGGGGAVCLCFIDRRLTVCVCVSWAVLVAPTKLSESMSSSHSPWCVSHTLWICGRIRRLSATQPFPSTTALLNMHRMWGVLYLFQALSDRISPNHYPSNAMNHGPLLNQL